MDPRMLRMLVDAIRKRRGTPPPMGPAAQQAPASATAGLTPEFISMLTDIRMKKEAAMNPALARGITGGKPPAKG